MPSRCSGGLCYLLGFVATVYPAALSTSVSSAGVLLQTMRATSSAVISGRVVDAQRITGVVGASVTVTGPDAKPRQMLSGSDGRFAFRDLPSGLYSLRATKAGYVDGSYGRRWPDGPDAGIQLAVGQDVSDLPVRVWKYAVISGRALDQKGEPVVGREIRVLRQSWLAGLPRLLETATARTDDRGLYRVPHLVPGAYVVLLPASAVTVSTLVAAAASQAASSIESPTRSNAGISSRTGRGVLVPLTATCGSSEEFANAPPIALTSGDERDGIDCIQREVNGFTVTGHVTLPGGTPAANVPVRLFGKALEMVGSEPGLDVATTTTEADGSFALLGVPSGTYVLRCLYAPLPASVPSTSRVAGELAFMQTRDQSPLARPRPPVGADLWAESSLSVTDQDVDVAVRLKVAARLTGRLVFNGPQQPRPEEMHAFTIFQAQADGRVTYRLASYVDADGSFTTLGAPPGKYFLTVTGVPGWFVVSVSLRGQDVTDAAIDLEDSDIDQFTIVLARRPAGTATISGLVTSRGRGVKDALVVAFPVNQSAWTNFGPMPRRFISSVTGILGEYSLDGLEPGDYFVSLLPLSAGEQWQRPEVLRSLQATSLRIHVNAGDQQRRSIVDSSMQ